MRKREKERRGIIKGKAKEKGKKREKGKEEIT